MKNPVIQNVNMTITKYVVGQTQEEISEKVKFSKLIDESTDRGFAKTMCVCV